MPRIWADSRVYLHMARGDGGHVLMPWAGRILLPLVARGLSSLLACDLTFGFEVVAVVALLLFLGALVPIWRKSALAPGYSAAGYLLSPLVLLTLQTVHITDMLHMGLVALLLVTIGKRNALLGPILMIALIMTRESSLALAAVAVAVFGWARRKQLTEALALAAGASAGLVAVHHFVAGAANVHRMPEWLYLTLKIPANFLRNVIGVSLWTNAHTWCDTPVYTATLPGTIHFGLIHEVGFCDVSIGPLLASLTSVLTVFGVLPAMLLASLEARGRSWFKEADGPWLIAFWYGIVLLPLGLVTGAPVDRQIGFAWPAFLVALPQLVPASLGLPGRLRWRLLLALQLVTSWLPFVVNALPFVRPYEPATADTLSFMGLSELPVLSVVYASIGLCGNVIAYRALRADCSEIFSIGARFSAPWERYGPGRS